jgi:hypothetical protein
MVSAIKKIENKEEIQLNEYDCIISLPSGIHKFNLDDVSENDLMEFIKEQNLFSDNIKLKTLKFIFK